MYGVDWIAHLGTPGIVLIGGGLVHSALCSSLAVQIFKLSECIVELSHQKCPPPVCVSLRQKPCLIFWTWRRALRNDWCLEPTIGVSPDLTWQPVEEERTEARQPGKLSLSEQFLCSFVRELDWSCPCIPHSAWSAQAHKLWSIQYSLDTRTPGHHLYLFILFIYPW